LGPTESPVLTDDRNVHDIGLAPIAQGLGVKQDGIRKVTAREDRTAWVIDTLHGRSSIAPDKFQVLPGSRAA
jgi:hypothetical protein